MQEFLRRYWVIRIFGSRNIIPDVHMKTIVVWKTTMECFMNKHIEDLQVDVMVKMLSTSEKLL